MKKKKITLCFRTTYNVLLQYLSMQVNIRMKTSSQKNELKQFIVKLSKQNIKKKNIKKLLAPPFFSISTFSLTFCRVLGLGAEATRGLSALAPRVLMGLFQRPWLQREQLLIVFYSCWKMWVYFHSTFQENGQIWTSCFWEGFLGPCTSQQGGCRRSWTPFLGTRLRMPGQGPTSVAEIVGISLLGSSGRRKF